MAMVMLGIDLAKNVLALHGENEASQLEMTRWNVHRKRQDLVPRCSDREDPGSRRNSSLLNHTH